MHINSREWENRMSQGEIRYLQDNIALFCILPVVFHTFRLSHILVYHIFK